MKVIATIIISTLLLACEQPSTTDNPQIYTISYKGSSIDATIGTNCFYIANLERHIDHCDNQYTYQETTSFQFTTTLSDEKNEYMLLIYDQNDFPSKGIYYIDQNIVHVFEHSQFKVGTTTYYKRNTMLKRLASGECYIKEDTPNTTSCNQW